MSSTAKKPLLLRTWDIESTNWNEFKIACIYDGKESIFCDSPKEVITAMIKLGGTFFAHFAGGYDNLFLLEELKRFSIRVKNIKGRLVQISVYYKNSKRKLFELRDSFPLLPSALASLQKDFGVPMGISSEKWAYYKKRRNKIHKFTREELEEYVEVDTIVLYKVLREAEGIFGAIDKMTIASEAKAKMAQMSDLKQMWLPSRMDKYLRKSYSGGRVEVFKRHGKNLKYYDFNSMYPTVMHREEYPAGLAVYSSYIKPNKFGIYTVRVKAPKLQIPFLHAYDENGKLLFPVGTWEATYTSIELEKAKKLGYEIEVIEGYYFTKKCRPFVDYVEHFHALKNKASHEGKGALKYVAKLYLNSPYGKLGQRRHFSKVVAIEGSLREMARKHKITEVMEDLNLCVIDDISRCPYTTVHIASFITAYSRIMLYEAMEMVQERGGQVYYCDTDSIVCDVELPTGEELGDLELENEISEGFFLFPKFYAFRRPNGDEVSRSKGFSCKFPLEKFRIAYKHDSFTMFKGKKEGIIGLLEGQRRHKHHLDILIRTRRVKGVFTKRKLLADGNHTSPLELIR